jgi:hypothetical protein
MSVDDFIFCTYVDEIRRFKKEKANAKRIVGTISHVSVGEEHRKYGLFFKVTKSQRVFCVPRDHPKFDEFDKIVQKGNDIDFLLFPNNTTAVLYVLDFSRSSLNKLAVLGMLEYKTCKRQI